MAAIILDAARPFSFIFAQVMFVGQPFLSILISKDQFDAFTGFLDNPNEVSKFIKSLRYQNKSINDGVYTGD
jgi:hypothetical protein